MICKHCMRCVTKMSTPSMSIKTNQPRMQFNIIVCNLKIIKQVYRQCVVLCHILYTYTIRRHKYLPCNINITITDSHLLEMI